MTVGADAWPRVVLLGGTSEIGLAIVRALPRDAAREVVLAGRGAGALDEASQALAADTGARVTTLALDATRLDTHAGLLGEALRGGPALMIVAVGTLGERGGFPDDVDRAVADMQLNFVGAGSLLLHAAHALRAGGGGTVVVLSSVAAVRPRRTNFVYGAAKAGLDGLAQGLADALASATVRVMVVRPGFVRTRMTHGLAVPPLATTPEAVAAATVRGLQRGSATVWVPAATAVLGLVLRLLPRPLFRRLSL
jgi:decaprenylphospho-beta-D-erythro-pentofuranosid-2-ulose 2-reductase